MIVEVKNAAYGYNTGEYVFEEVNFSVAEGEIFSILGPNGSGKSTLLKCINGLFRIKRGEIRIGGENIDGLNKNTIGRKVGYVAQARDATFPYTVFEMVLMGRAPYLGLFSSPVAGDRKIAKEAIETLGISHLADRPHSNLSGGEAQLVLIARALAAEPKVLLLDEPTSHLDFKNQMVILEVLDMLARERNIAAVMTTHFPDHALSISDKALLMGRGKVVMTGSPAKVITEEHLKNVFEMNVRILPYEEGGRNGKTVIPLRKAVAGEDERRTQK